MAECSGRRFKPLDKPIEEYITDHENKSTRTKSQQDVKLLTTSISAGEKLTEKLKKFNQKSSTAISELNGCVIKSSKSHLISCQILLCS